MSGQLSFDAPITAQLRNQQVLVIGGGVTGEGIVSFLKSLDCAITVLDEREVLVDGIPSKTAIPSDGTFQLAITSPGWKFDHPLILEVRKRNIPIISEVDLAWLVKNEINPNQKWIALTGTNGKTTTIQMVASILESAGVHGIACGNVGEPVITAVADSKRYDVLALELSSFQIEWSQEPRFHASALLNIAEDHIDWHGSFDAYANAKFKLLLQSDCAILNLDDPEVAARSTAIRSQKIFYSLDTPQPGELGLVEELLVDRAFGSDPSKAEVIAELSEIQPTVPHNVSNALAAAGLALTLGIPHESIRAGLARFRPDHHRLEEVAEIAGVKWVDDSKATNPHAASASLLSYLSVVWIAGGLAKGATMDELVKRTGSRVKSAILIGQDREVIAAALAAHAPHVEIHRIDKGEDLDAFLDAIVAKAHSLAAPGDTVLLAPACASMDQFRSYAQRGDAFAAAVGRLNSRLSSEEIAL